MTKLFPVLFAAAFAAFSAFTALAPSSVSAQDFCSGPLCPPASTPATVAPPFQPFDLEVTGMVLGVGEGLSIIGGSDGVVGDVFATRDSMSVQDIETWLASDLCVTDDCESGGFNITQSVQENVASGGTAFNTGGAGVAAGIGGQTMSQVITDLMIRYTNTPPAE